MSDATKRQWLNATYSKPVRDDYTVTKIISGPYSDNIWSEIQRDISYYTEVNISIKYVDGSE